MYVAKMDPVALQSTQKRVALPVFTVGDAEKIIMRSTVLVQACEMVVEIYNNRNLVGNPFCYTGMFNHWQLL